MEVTCCFPSTICLANSDACCEKCAVSASLVGVGWASVEVAVEQIAVAADSSFTTSAYSQSATDVMQMDVRCNVHLSTTLAGAVYYLHLYSIIVTCEVDNIAGVAGSRYLCGVTVFRPQGGHLDCATSPVLP
jgi:hypothetical protein